MATPDQITPTIDKALELAAEASSDLKNLCDATLDGQRLPDFTCHAEKISRSIVKLRAELYKLEAAIDDRS